MRIGILGGTFNPVHNGHLLLALGAQRHLGLHRVLWIPTHVPPHKAMQGNATPEDRARMVQLALQGHPGFELSRVELERPPPSYTIDTVLELRTRRPERGAEWFFLVGSDTASELPAWRRIEALRKLVRFAAVPRSSGGTRKPIPGWVELLPVTTVDVSSSEVRRRIRRGENTAGLLPAPVREYVHRRGLYQ